MTIVHFVHVVDDYPWCVCLMQTGLTPLEYASKWGSVEAVHLLLYMEADINQVATVQSIEFLF